MLKSTPEMFVDGKLTPAGASLVADAIDLAVGSRLRSREAKESPAGRRDRAGMATGDYA